MFGQGNHHQKMPSKTALCLGYPVDVQWFSRDFHINNSFLQPPMAHGRPCAPQAIQRGPSRWKRHRRKNRDGRGSRGRGVWVSGRGGQSDGHHHQLLVLQQGLLPWRWTYLVLRWEVGKKKHGCFEILLNLSGNHLSGWFDSVEKRDGAWSSCEEQSESVWGSRGKCKIVHAEASAELAKLDPKLAELAEQNSDSIIIDSISGRDGRHGDWR